MAIPPKTPNSATAVCTESNSFLALQAGFVKNVKDVVQVGQSVGVTVLQVDAAKGRVSLGLKGAAGALWCGCCAWHALVHGRVGMLFARPQRTPDSSKERWRRLQPLEQRSSRAAWPWAVGGARSAKQHGVAAYRRGRSEAGSGGRVLARQITRG